MALADRRIHLRRETQVATAAVRAAHLDYDWAATHPAESVVGGQKDCRDSLAERRAALFERKREAVHQRFLPGELIIDR